MKKVIRLTEDDLSRIVKRVVKEQSNKRLLREQQETNDLVGKTINIYTDQQLTKQLATVKVVSLSKGNNSATIKVEGIRIDGWFMDTFQINCGSNVISINKVLVLPGKVSQKSESAYVSQKLVDYLKPTICQQSTQPQQSKSDF